MNPLDDFITGKKPRRKYKYLKRLLYLTLFFTVVILSIIAFLHFYI